ncbi:MAG TPA: DeoR/GlpR family DNA-binding transcription regulator [Candidatus Blautia gallistercoris]|uniref:DeoR/GlpR family DNA-binding transcription regulator n=1 Tax=Candidatus Blautia gallistercoris TaxID=2838490 RepID=A0A9D1WJN1_9FIRM|nr:DeoR/GlpR family DNA-binding transcription regulator [Candidatus Blautia gallistercoris]
MSVEKRHQLILEQLSVKKRLTSQEIGELTGASEATVRRDLAVLEGRGLLTRTYGGAKAMVQGRTVSEKAGAADPYLANKTQVAKTASRLIREGDTVFLGAGKTCMLLAREIKYKTNIKVITTSINVINELADAPEVSLFLVGGDIYVGDNYLEALGEYTHQYLAQLYLEKSFVTVDGISMEHGYSIVNHRQIPLYQHLLNHSKEFYLLADGHKFNKRYYSRLWSIQRVQNLVTDNSVDEKYIKYFHNAGIHCYCDR